MLEYMDLVLVNIDNEMNDLCGNHYEENITLNDRTFNKNSYEGFFGVLWGKTPHRKWLNIFENDKFAIVKARHKDILLVDKEYNLVKFKSATVVHIGSLLSSFEFIRNNKNQNIQFITKTQDESPPVSEIAGFEGNNAKDFSSPISSNSFKAEVITNDIQSHAIVSGCDAAAISMGFSSHSVTLEHHGFAETVGDTASHSVTFEQSSFAIASSHYGKAIALGIASSAKSKGENGLAACLDMLGAASAAPGGAIILGWMDYSGRIRYSVGYVGEDIEANVKYRCENGVFVKEEEIEDDKEKDMLYC